MLAPVLSCAALKPVPAQTLDCLENSGVAAASAAAICVARGGGPSTVEWCALGAGSGLIECEALAIWGDITHAQTVASSAAVPVATVQANAKAYLVAKGVTVTHQ
jgi:hypothetical protein